MIKTHLPSTMHPRSPRPGLSVWFLIVTFALGASPVPGQPSESPATDAPVEESTTSQSSEATSDAEDSTPEEKKLPRLEEMELPSAEQLLREPRVDWIVLKHNQEVIVAEPVTPRPDTLAKMQAAIDEKNKQRRGGTPEAMEAFRAEIDAMSKLRLRLPDQVDEADYLLPTKMVEQIIHHEDLVLRRVEVLIQQQSYELAYEMLNLLRREAPDWPGALDRHNALMLAEADRKIERSLWEDGLAMLEEIYTRSPHLAGLPERFARVIDALMEQAVTADDFRRARHFLGRLVAAYPEHPSIETWRTRLIADAESELTAAEQARSQQDHRLALSHAERAVRIWPGLSNLRPRFRPYADRYQCLRVGVLSLPEPDRDMGVIRSQAASRADRLQDVPFFEVDRVTDGAARYGTRYCDRWEPLNLGRDVVFELRTRRQPWESQPEVTAPVIAARLAARLDPSHSLYDERFAGYVRSINVQTPYDFTLEFHRVPVHPESLLAIPLMDTQTTPSLEEGDATTVSLVESHDLVGGFKLAALTDETASYRRARPEPDGLRNFHIAEVEERRFADAEAAMQALHRGDVSMLVRPPARHVELLRGNEELLKAYFVEKMAVPVSHVVQFHPRSEPLKNRELRRALAYGIDRDRILKDIVLKGSSGTLGRLINGPFPSQSVANNALVQRRPHDPVSAVALALAARKQLSGGGELPTLRMAVVDDPVAREAAQELVASWARFGITVQMLDEPAEHLIHADSDSVDWDLLYRTVQLTEPATQLWPFLTVTGRANVADLDPFPDWLRRELIDLDLATDWKGALQALHQLDLHLWGEVMLIPLWEVDDFLIYRKNIRGVPVSPVHPYQDIDQWVVETWYPEDQP